MDPVQSRLSLTDALVVGKVKNKANEFVTSGNAVLKSDI
jgi:hypothetical protein